MFAASRARPGGADAPLARIEAANRRYLVTSARNARLIAVIEEMAIRDPYFRDLKLQIRELFLRRNESGIRRLQRRGLADPELDPAITASALGGMVEHFTQMWFVHGVTFDEELAVATLTRLWAQAIGLRVEAPADG